MTLRQGRRQTATVDSYVSFIGIIGSFVQTYRITRENESQKPKVAAHNATSQLPEKEEAMDTARRRKK